MIYDYIVIGSGFGGSVAALRLAEKGYSVRVIESGKRWRLTATAPIGRDFFIEKKDRMEIIVLSRPRLRAGGGLGFLGLAQVTS